MRRGSRHTLDLLKRFCRLFFAMVLSGNATLICYLSTTNFTLWATYSFSDCLALSRLLCIISHPPSKVNRFLQKNVVVFTIAHSHPVIVQLSYLPLPLPLCTMPMPHLQTPNTYCCYAVLAFFFSFIPYHTFLQNTSYSSVTNLFPNSSPCLYA